MEAAHKLVLCRHGESEWNKLNLFSGWVDVGLSEKGVNEAHDAAIMIKERGLEFDMAFTSKLKRAIKTLDIILEDTDQMFIPVVKDWRLNERHYGALQGLNKVQTVEKHGSKQVEIWRRAYDVRPPPLPDNDPSLPGNSRAYQDVPPEKLPRHECLKDTFERFIPLWEEEIVPLIKANKRLLITAHGNSIRALVKYLDNISDDDITALNIPTGIPLVYEFDADLKPIKQYYLADEETVKAAIAAVANQTKAQAK
jgi:2,3-bisphosphoglycerate-dependent phosphoglycerate mutase